MVGVAEAVVAATSNATANKNIFFIVNPPIEK
jgi:hypothetical protein